MKYKISTLSGLKKKLDIHLSPEQVQKGFDEHYKKKQQKAHLPGFRKGKVPLNQIRALYQEEVTKDTAISLVDKFYLEVLEQEQIEPAGDIEKLDFKSSCEEGQAFDFSIVLDVQPEFDIDKSFKVQLSKPSVEVTEEEVDRYVKYIQVSSAKYVPLTERKPVSWNDFVELKINQAVQKKAEPPKSLLSEENNPAGENKSVEEKNFAGAPSSAEEKPNPPVDVNGPSKTDIQLLKEGKPLFLEVKKEPENFPLKGLIEGILGMQTGEQKKIPVVFSEEYHVKEQVGQPMNVEVKLMEIKKQVLPNDDELFKICKCKDMTELKKLVGYFLKGLKRDKVYQILKDQVLRQLVEKNPISFLPEGVVERQKQNIISSSVNSLKEKGMTEQEIEKYKKEQEKEFQEEARFMVHSAYLMFDLARKLNISASSKEIRDYLKATAKGKNPSEEDYDHAETFLVWDKMISYLIDTAEPPA